MDLVKYQRTFTGINPLQQEQQITYALRTGDQEAAYYGVVVSQSIVQAGGQVCTNVEMQTHLSNRQEPVEQVLLFLYENAVTPATLADVVRDIKVRGFFNQDKVEDYK